MKQFKETPKERVLKEYSTAAVREKKGLYRIVYVHRYGEWTLSRECDNESAAWESAAALNTK